MINFGKKTKNNFYRAYNRTGERTVRFGRGNCCCAVYGIILPLSALSAIIYLFKADIPWIETIAVSVGGIIGGFIGAKLLNKISGRWLHIIFGAAMLMAAVRMFI